MEVVFLAILEDEVCFLEELELLSSFFCGGCFAEEDEDDSDFSTCDLTFDLEVFFLTSVDCFGDLFP